MSFRNTKAIFGSNHKENSECKLDPAIFSSFSFVKGIGPKNSVKLSQSGVANWSDVKGGNCPDTFPSQKWNDLLSGIKSATEALNSFDSHRLGALIPKNQHWKMIPLLLDNIAYLDIETTGLSPYNSHITTIAVYDGHKVHDFVRDDNLDEFPNFIAKFPAIVTFYGKSFDIPFIRKEMGISFPQIHFDVCFLLKKLGYKGGLKKIERKFGLTRDNTKGLDGFAAVLLWKSYKRSNDSRYLDTLLAYNNDDVINLEYLLYQSYNKLVVKERLSVPRLRLEQKHIRNPHPAHKEIVNEIIRKMRNY